MMGSTDPASGVPVSSGIVSNQACITARFACSTRVRRASSFAALSQGRIERDGDGGDVLVGAAGQRIDKDNGGDGGRAGKGACGRRRWRVRGRFMLVAVESVGDTKVLKSSKLLGLFVVEMSLLCNVAPIPACACAQDMIRHVTPVDSI